MGFICLRLYYIIAQMTMVIIKHFKTKPEMQVQMKMLESGS